MRSRTLHVYLLALLTLLLLPRLQAGVKDIVLAVNYRPEVMVSVLKKTEDEFGIKITFSVETEPLGTGQLVLSA